MKKTVFAWMALAAAVTAPAWHSPPRSRQQTLDRRAIGDLEFSPDGSRLVFTVTGRSRERPARAVAPRRHERTAPPAHLAGKSDGSPRWAPDGGSIAFISDRDGTPHLYRLSMRGGEAEQLVTEPVPQAAVFRWSPDGSRIAVLMPEPKPAAQLAREKDKDDSRVVDKDNRRGRVWILDVASRKLTPLTAGSWQIAQIEWLPKGDRLIASADATPASDRWHEHLYAIDLNGGAFTEIAAPNGPLGAFSLSPDGRTIAYVGARVDGPDAHDLFVQPVAGGAPRNLTASAIDRPASQPRWLDNQTLAAQIARGFSSTIAIVDHVAAPGAAARMLDGLGVNPSSYAHASSGTFAYAGETATHAPELWIKTAGGPARAVSRFNERWSSIPVVAPEFVKYTSADGVEIEAALLRPSAASSQLPASSPGRLPFVVLVHGGPTGRWSDTFEPWGQLLAARGYAVLYPNVRGSVGRAALHRMNRADWGGRRLQDVMAGVDKDARASVPNRGPHRRQSYGAAWRCGGTHRAIQGRVSGAPVIDMASGSATKADQRRVVLRRI